MSAASAREIAAARREYADELRQTAQLSSEALVRAFARVPREHYLGPGPWQILSPTSRDRGSSSDPRDLYRDVLVSIDKKRGLNNGQPSGLAMWFDALELRRGERVYHVGAGVGYYTAILANVVGLRGSVIGVEIDRELAGRAIRNLAEVANASVHHADGTRFDPGPVDAIFINAGATHVLPLWLDLLKPGGRLLLPMTLCRQPHKQMGVMLGVTREEKSYAARVESNVGIFPCAGATDEGEDSILRAALDQLAEYRERIASLRRDPHPRDASCWIHGRDTCVSTRPQGA